MSVKRTSSTRQAPGRGFQPKELSPVPNDMFCTSPEPNHPTSSAPRQADQSRSKSPPRPAPQDVGDMEDTLLAARPNHRWVDKPKLSQEEIEARRRAHQDALQALISEGMSAADAKKIVQQQERNVRRNGGVHVPQPEAASSVPATSFAAVSNQAVGSGVKRVVPPTSSTYFTYNSLALPEIIDHSPIQYGEHFHVSAFGPVRSPRRSHLFWALAVLCAISVLVQALPRLLSTLA